MIESVQRFVQDACLSALGLIGGVSILYWISVAASRFFVRIRAVGIGLALLLSLAAVIVTGEAQKRIQDGTTGTSRPTIVQVGWRATTPPIMQEKIAPVGRVVPNAPPAQSPRASATMPFRAAKWNVRGAWDDSFRYAFAGDWVFPFGTNHLDRVEVCSQGRIIPRYGSEEVIASVGVPLQIVNPITSFGCGPTDRNSYIFAWTNAVVGRALRGGAMGTSRPAMDASIELFRNGDVGVTTNGISRLIPRVHPSDFDGDGRRWCPAPGRCRSGGGRAARATSCSAPRRYSATTFPSRLTGRSAASSTARRTGRTASSRLRGGRARPRVVVHQGHGGLGGRGLRVAGCGLVDAECQ